MINTATPEGREKRRQQLFAEEAATHRAKAKHRGDYHYLAYQSLTGDGDFSPHDHGEPPMSGSSN